jgi:uncharacterized protein YqhQ
MTDATGTRKYRLAGMALRNGVLVIGPTHWSASVRTPDGAVVTTTRPRPSLGHRSDAVPLLRGPVRVAEMLAILPALRLAMPEARLAFESPAVIGGTILGSVATKAIRRRLGPVGFAPEIASGAVSLAVLLAAMRGGDLSRYHGAEHKVIGAYERDIDAVDATKEHERCGTHLAVPMLVANVLATEGARKLLPQQYRHMARMVGAVAGLGASTELARATQANDTTPVARALARLGMKLQSMASTSEPTEDQLEVAAAALDALLAAEGPVPAAA